MLNKYFSSKTARFQYATACIVILIVASVGTYLLTGSHAATPYTSTTADSGSLTGSAAKKTCSGASDGSCVAFGSSGGGGAGLYNGKLLGLNSALDDLSEVGNPNAWKELGVNSIRGDIELNGTSFSDPSYDGTTAQWINTLTAQHIVPLPLLNQYIEMQDLNVSQFVSATVAWCQSYCAGGSFYTSSQGNNGQSDPAYAPQVLEILNEPYYGASYGYPVTTTDVAAYATLLKAIRAGLDSAGLTDIGILAGANNNSGGTANWDTQLTSDGGFAAAQGVTIHPYGPVDTSCTPSTGTSDCTVTSGDTSGTNTSGWGQLYYIHQFLDSNGLTSQANNVYITEDGWCNSTTADECSGGEFSETQKDQNITATINQLATVSWFKGFWYFNLIPYQDCYEGQCAENTYGLYTPYPALALTPAWTVFQSAAQANGF